MKVDQTICQKQGGSRAAKKRAKKRQQQHLQNETKELHDVDGGGKPKEGAKVPKKKKKKIEQTLIDDEHLKDATVMNSKQKKEKQEAEGEHKPVTTVSRDDDHVRDEDDSLHTDDEAVIDEILSQLNPIEILFPERLIGKVNNNDSDEEAMNPLILIQHIETKKRARALFNSMLAPSGIDAEEFYMHYWEKKPLVISKSKNIADFALKGNDEFHLNAVGGYGEEEESKYRSRLNGFLSKATIRELISNHPMRYGKDLNVTNFCKTGHGEKRRITLDQLPQINDNNEKEDDVEYIVAESDDVWQNFDNGCTIRLLCPHKHNDEIHSLLSNMEYEFGCMVGANAYLTPGGGENQGFAPHYDDIEAFILQLDGFKHWRVYPPMSKNETLPRESSRDFTEKDMKDISPVIDIELGPGDLLYMPRGWIHQANTCRRNHHSLHLTMSAMQNWAWVDFLDILIPEALESAAAKSVSLRSGLPRNFLSYMGTMYEQLDAKPENMPEALQHLASKIGEVDTNGENTEDDDEKEVEAKKRMMVKLQDSFKAEAKKKIMRVCKEALELITIGCDEMAKRFLSDRLPPAFTPQELALTSESRAENGGKIWPNTMVRLAKPGIAHLVVEDDKAVIYHNADNSRVYHETPLSPLEFEIDDAPALEALVTTVEPHWICVRDLLHGDIEDKMEIAQSLYDEGILAIYQSEAPDTSVQTG